MYVAATSVITVRQYSFNTTLTFSEKKQGENVTAERIRSKLTGHYCYVTSSKEAQCYFNKFQTYEYRKEYILTILC